MNEPKFGRIVRLEVDNVKRLKAVRITPEGALVILSGDNDQGKSSVIDSIRFALGGPAAMKDTPRLIRDGQIAAKVLAEFEDVTVTRTMIEGKQAVVLEPKDGSPKLSSPQSILDKALTSLTFDPLKFAGLPPKEQRKILLDMVDIGFDPDAHDAKIAEIYAQRTVFGREVTRLQGVLKSAPEIPEDTPQVPIDVTALNEKYQAAVRHNGALDRAREQIANRAREIEALDETIEALEAQLLKARADRAHKMADNVRAEDALAKAAGWIDTNALVVQIARVDTVNRDVDNLARKQQVERELAQAKRDVAGCTERMQELEKQKVDGLAAVEFPLEGLSIDSDGVTFNNIPLSQASESQRVKTSARIQMALNPHARVMLIDNGNALDTNNLQVLADMAEEFDYQIWMTYVGDSGRQQVIIEDGEVA